MLPFILRKIQNIKQKISSIKLDAREKILLAIFLPSFAVYYFFTRKFSFELLAIGAHFLLFLITTMPLVFFLLFLKFTNKKELLPAQIFKRTFSFVRKIMPLVFVGSLYENLHNILTVIPNKTFDLTMLRIDEFIFNGKTPSVWMENSITPFYSNFFSIMYSLYIFFPFLIIFLFHYQNKNKKLDHFIITLTLVIYSAIIIFMLIPVEGPQYAFPEIYHIPLSQERIVLSTQDIVNGLRYTRDAFPSLHIAITFTYLLFAYINYRKIFYLTLPLIISIWISTIYLRYHYFIDWIASFLLVFIAFYISKKLLRLQKEEPVQKQETL